MTVLAVILAFLSAWFYLSHQVCKHEYKEVIKKHNGLVDTYNSLVREYNELIEVDEERTDEMNEIKSMNLLFIQAISDNVSQEKAEEIFYEILHKTDTKNNEVEEG